MSVLRFVLGASLCATAAATAHAAPSDSASPSENLDCALWASIVAGSSDDEAVKAGTGMALGYFIGLFEAASARDIDEPMIARAAQITEAELGTLNPICSARMVRYGTRLVTLGKRMQAIGRDATAR